MNHPELIDTTLREGAQAPGVNFTQATKLAIISWLKKVGVDEIELGTAAPLHGWLAEFVRQARAIVGSKCRLALWCRCKAEDIAFAAVCQPDLLSLSIPVSDRHIQERLGKDRAWVLAALEDSVRLALAQGIAQVSVGLEDASRADLPFLLEVARTAERSGAWRVRIADTVGICSPGRMAALVQAVKDVVRCTVGVHCHNDFGMATANSIAALEAGADCFDAAVLGLGERAGCCKLEEAAGYLALVQEQPRIKPEHLATLCQIVAKASGKSIAASHPLVGADIFTCETGLHQHGLAINPATYEPYPPERVGSRRSLRFGSKTGFRAVALQLEKHGLRCEESEIRQLTGQLRSSDAALSESELLRAASNAAAKRLRRLMHEDIGGSYIKTKEIHAECRTEQNRQESMAMNSEHCIFPPSRFTTEALEVKALHRIVKLIDSAVHLDSVLSAILKVLHDTLRMERATLALLDEGGERLAIRASYGLTIEEEQRGVYRLDEGVCGKIFSSASPFIVPDVSSEPLFLNRTGARPMYSKTKLAFIGVPVLLGEKPVGVLSVDRLFGMEVSLEEDVRFLTVLATLIAQFLSLNQAIRRDRQQLVQENISLKAQLHERHRTHRIIGHCKAMQEVFWSIERVAPSQATVLLLGDSGTGKEMAAQAIHEASPRRDRPFVKINCAALPESLLESELFGHEKGAFTGAGGTRIGRFELADKGSLFLDEIGEMPLPLQAKLLRVLQEQQFERLGSNRTISVDVRIIAATNVSLEQAVAAGSFRNDLYYRLNVVPIILPSLRERRDDIPLLVDYFLKQSNQRNKKSLRMSRDFLDAMTVYDWPGNVRELQNLIERLVILSAGDLLRLEDLPDCFFARNREPELPKTAACAPKVRKSLQETEREQVEDALMRHGWVQARAARELGLTQRQIGYKIQKFKLKQPEFAQ